MYSTRQRNEKQKKSKKVKGLTKLINNSDSGGDESEHELSFYIKDRVKLMKEVLSIIKPKKIKSMAPDCIKNMDIEEINSMLLEELLGISNKRLKYIFEGKNLDEDSSSTEDDKSPDVISLDDISDDDFIIEINSDDENKPNKKQKHKQMKEEPRSKKIKKEKSDKHTSKHREKEPMGEENLMSVLELLELQARARAIRSQLALEASKKEQELAEKNTQSESEKKEDDEDAVIVEVPKEEIVITSSDSDNEEEQVEKSQDGLNKEIDKPNSSKDNKTDDSCEEVGNTKNKIVETNLASTENEIIKETTSIVENEKHIESDNLSKENDIEGTDASCKSSTTENDTCQETSPVKETEKANESEKSRHESEKVVDVEMRKSEKIKIRRFKSKLESCKKDVNAEETNVKIIDSIVIKPSISMGQKSGDYNDGLVINIDQDDIDCIISD